MPTHDERIQGLDAAFASAQQQLVTTLEGLQEEVARRVPPDGGWSPAQIGVHVGISNEWLAASLNGTRPIAEPAPPDFLEDWSAITIPPKVKTFPQLEPAQDATRAMALERLRSSAEQVTNAIRGLSPERAVLCVKFPFGTLSLYQVAEFLTAHVERHRRQLQRTLASIQ